MPTELQRFVDRLPLGEALHFPGGSDQLYQNTTLGVLGMVTGEGLRKASIAVALPASVQRSDCPPRS